ncbi:MAG: hypothetical protein L6Q99_21265 [Planctomycetes bacterium]|nr:hypothetical protein [Planctomycetota bacterium]
MSDRPDEHAATLVVFEAPEGSVRVDVRVERDTVWLPQQRMAAFLGRKRSAMTKTIRNASESGEPDPTATSARFAQVRTEGARHIPSNGPRRDPTAEDRSAVGRTRRHPTSEPKARS